MRAFLIRFAVVGLSCLLAAACALTEPESPEPEPRAVVPACPAPAATLAPPSAPAVAAPRPPALEPSAEDTAPGWFDLRAQGLNSWNDLEKPLRRSLASLESRPQEAVAVRRAGLRLTWGELARSARELLELLPRLDREPGLLAERFQWLAVQPAPLMTAYCTPEIAASLTRGKGYEYPLYGPPPELAQADVQDPLPAWPEAAPQGRGASDAVGTLAGRGLEIAWARDPLDVFYVQVEGAGRLRLPSGRVRTAQYAASNGRSFRSLSAILCERGLLPPERRSRREVRRFFRDNPGLAAELMAENRRFVFFRLDDGPPLGALNRPLTPLVSVATDPSLLPLGAVLVLDAEIPDPAGRGTRRIRGPALAQDVGAAIRGPRLDLYMGEGAAAEDAAERIKTPVAAYLLLRKDPARPWQNAPQGL
jgi:membrane-bound lytic murein transglycosylase A